MSNNNAQDLVKKALEDFNRLPDSTINPLMIGLLLLGTAISIFNPGMVVYLTLVFGASAGMAYAASKNQTAHMPLPTWAITSIGIASALIYGIAGMPGLMLTAGVSGGWYLNSYFGHHFQQWKANFQNFLTEFKSNPVRQSANLIFNALQFLGDLLTPVENIPPATTAQEAQENPVLPSEAAPEEMPRIAPNAIAAIPTTSHSALVTVTTPKPETAVIRFLGSQILTTSRKEIKIDFAKGYGLPGLLKTFWYSLNPMNNIVDINKDKDKNKNKNKGKNIEIQPKPILALTNNARLETPQPAPVVFRHVPLSQVKTPPVIVAENNQGQPLAAAHIIQSPASTASESASLESVPPAAKPNPDPILFYQLPTGMRFFEDMINRSVFLDYRPRI